MRRRRRRRRMAGVSTTMATMTLMISDMLGQRQRTLAYSKAKTNNMREQ
jgi:hypothetical protein